LDLMMERVSDPIRKTFGKELREHGTVLSDIARSRAEIDQARLLVLSAARKVDTHGAKAAMKEIGIAKVCPFFPLFLGPRSPFFPTILSLFSTPSALPRALLEPFLSFLCLDPYQATVEAGLTPSSPSLKWPSRL
jgi:hypothetical protein